MNEYVVEALSYYQQGSVECCSALKYLTEADRGVMYGDTQSFNQHWTRGGTQIHTLAQRL